MLSIMLQLFSIMSLKNYACMYTMFDNIGIYIYKFWVLLFLNLCYSLSSTGFTSHKAKQLPATSYGFARGKEKKKKIKGLSNNQRSQMHAYIALKKM